MTTFAYPWASSCLGFSRSFASPIYSLKRVMEFLWLDRTTGSGWSYRVIYPQQKCTGNLQKSPQRKTWHVIGNCPKSFQAFQGAMEIMPPVCSPAASLWNLKHCIIVPWHIPIILSFVKRAYQVQGRVLRQTDLSSTITHMRAWASSFWYISLEGVWSRYAVHHPTNPQGQVRHHYGVSCRG